MGEVYNYELGLRIWGIEREAYEVKMDVQIRRPLVVGVVDGETFKIKLEVGSVFEGREYSV